MRANYIELVGEIVGIYVRNRFNTVLYQLKLKCVPQYKRTIRTAMFFYIPARIVIPNRDPKIEIQSNIYIEGFLDKPTGSNTRIVVNHYEII